VVIVAKNVSICEIHTLWALKITEKVHMLFKKTLQAAGIETSWLIVSLNQLSLHRFILNTDVCMAYYKNMYVRLRGPLGPWSRCGMWMKQ
jgi:hypothetical protein